VAVEAALALLDREREAHTQYDRRLSRYVD
jgi:hypothetical protein